MAQVGVFSPDDFAAKWTELYRQLIAMGYFDDDGTEVSFPPHQELSKSLQKFDLDPLVIEVLNKIPIPKTQNWCILPQTHPVCYLEDSSHHPEFARNPSKLYFGVLDGNAADLGRSEILLAAAAEFGKNVILNVADGTLRMSESEDLDEMEPVPYPAKSIVKPYKIAIDEFLMELKKLNWIPLITELGDSSMSETINGLSDTHRRILRTFVREYGWPDNFRRADWMKDKDSVYQDALNHVEYP